VSEVTLAEALAKRGPVAEAPVSAEIQLAVSASGGSVNAAQVEVLRRTICSKLDDNQLLLYLTRCARKGLDPFSDCYAFPQSDGGLAMGLRIDGMQALASRTGELLSVKVETLLVPDGEKKGTLLGARCAIERKGMTQPVVEEAYMAEYYHAGIGWDRFPETMIRKVSRAKCLRVAFADALGGIFEPAEMADAPQG